MPFKYPSMEERLIANSVLSIENFFEDTPCWEWVGQIHKTRGYGYLSIRLKGRGPVPRRAHKVSYETFVGPVPEGEVVMHRCNNRACIAPLHLRAGTQSDNIKQCVADGRHNSQQDVPDWHREF